MGKVLVSICCTAYNHEKFINECLDGFLMQKTNFEFEILIHDDASTDCTQSIIKFYQDKNRDIIKPIFQTENQYSKGVKPFIQFLFPKAKGKYIALCEGDDYWTDPLKLQKQVDFLEKNKDYEMCFTNVKIVNAKNETKKEKLIGNVSKTTYNHKDMPIWAPTLTRVFKNRDFGIINKNVPGGDTYMLVYQSTLGKIKFLDEITGAYRHHDGGVFSLLSKGNRHKHNIETRLACLQIVKKEFKKKYLGVILKELIDLKNVDTKVFNDVYPLIIKEFEEVKKVPADKYLLFLFYYNLIKWPFIYKSSFFRSSINKIFIY